MKRFLLVFFSTLSLALYSWHLQHPLHSSQVWATKHYDGPFSVIRSQFLAHLTGVSSDSAALVAGMAIGDTSKLSDLTSETMKVVSLTHLTAVSGANCAIVVGAVYLLISRFHIGRWLRILLAVTGLLGYVLLVGPEPSVLRAAVMGTIALLATGLGRAGAPSEALALCVIVLLLSDPWLSSNYGFQLSVLATIGILQLAPALTEKLSRRLPKWLALALAVSISAQLACLPVLLQLQPGLSTYSIPANIFAEPLVAPITILGIGACVLTPFTPWLTGVLSWIASLGAWLIIEIANFFVGMPASTIGWPSGGPGLALAITALFAIFAWMRSKSNRTRYLASFVAAVIAAAVLGSCTSQQIRSANWPPSDWSVVSCDVGQGDATVIQSEGQIAVIDVGREPGPIRRCLNHLGVRHIDLLVLTHFDLDHVGGIDGALVGRSVDDAVITSYQDDRPAAAITWRKLLQNANHLTRAFVGMNSTLGAFTWQVLSPHSGAPEAQDSNDGSVTILFRSSQLNLLTLADLGERGQKRLIEESAAWLGVGFGEVPMVVKVSHHGSSDQLAQLYEAIHAKVALFSVGLNNDYGHPTDKTLTMVAATGATIYRTDLQGSIAVSVQAEGLQVFTAGRG
jgi:competence protein ComEC